MTGHILVDLDGTLAKYTRWEGSQHVGDPIPLMVERVRAWLAAGADVRIFTARVSPVSVALNGETLESVSRPIQDWCYRHLGQVLLITHEKDMSTMQIWDDRCVQVEANTGRRMDGKE